MFKLDGNPEGILASPIHIFCEIQKFLQEPDGQLRNLEKIIRLDPLLAARLIRSANDKKNKNEPRIETISEAMSLVDPIEILSFAGKSKIMGRFQGIPNQLFNMHLFWLHSVIVAFTAQTIAILKNKGHPERYYVAGLLHDLGRLEICIAKPEMVFEVFKDQTTGGQSVIFYEEQHLEINHSAVGASLLSHWNFSEFLQAVVANHHDPLKNPKWKSEASILHLADHLAYEMGIGCGKIPSSGFNPEVTNILKLEKGALGFIYREMNFRLETLSDEYF